MKKIGILIFILLLAVMVSPSFAAYSDCAFGDCGSTSGGVATYTVCATDKTGSYKCDYTCDGTNDQTEINQAIDAAAALTTGGKVLLTEGSFYIGNNGTSVIPKSKVWLQGQGGATGTTILFATTGLANNPVIWNNGSSVSYFRASDFKIDGTAQRAVTWNVNQKGISEWGDTNTHNTYDHLWIYNTPATCLAPDGNDYLLVDSNILENCGTLAPNGPGGSGSPNGANGYPLGSNGIGYGQDDSGVKKHVIVTNNITINVADAGILFEEQGGTTGPDFGIIIENNYDYGSYNAIRISGTSGIIINGNSSYNADDSCFVATQNTFANIPYSDIQFSNNQCYTPGNHGIVVGTSPNSAASNIMVNNNLIDTPAGYGINLYSTTTTVIGNKIKSSGLDGIYWLSGANIADLVITNNTITSSGTLSTATHQSAINLKINSTFSITNLMIDGNLLKGSTGYGLTTELGAGTYSNFTFTNNNLISNTLGQTNLTGSTFTVGTNFFPFGNLNYATNFIGGDGITFPDLTVQTTAFNGTFGGTGGIVATGGINVPEGQDIKSNGNRINYNLSVYASGTAYVLTNSQALVNLSTKPATLVIQKPGTYAISGGVQLKYNAATFAANQTATCKITRTNNNAGDLPNASRTIDLRIITTITDNAGYVKIPDTFYSTENSDDSLSLYCGLSASPAAGTVDAVSADITAIRMY